jgi:hypothetical protein
VNRDNVEENRLMGSTTVQWPDEVHAVMIGDLTAAAAFVTTAAGAVVTGVAPCARWH